MKKFIFCAMMAVLTMSAYASDVGSTAPEVKSETLFSVPDITVIEAPSMECVTVNVVNMASDMVLVSAVEVKSIAGVPAPKLTPAWFTNGFAFSYDAAKLAPPNSINASWRLRHYGSPKFKRHSKLN